MTTEFEELCDQVDAAVFTSDALDDVDNRIMFAEFLHQWSKQLNEELWGEDIEE